MPKSRKRRSTGGATNETEVAGILLISAGIAVYVFVKTHSDLIVTVLKWTTGTVVVAVSLYVIDRVVRSRKEQRRIAQEKVDQERHQQRERQERKQAAHLLKERTAKRDREMGMSVLLPDIRTWASCYSTTVTGQMFAERIACHFRLHGAAEAKLIERRKSGSGDGGGDVLVLWPDGTRTVVQCKCWQKPVGVDAIGEVLRARGKHQASRAIVITSGRFTAEATEDARDNGVELWDGKRLNVEFDRIRTQIRDAEELIS